MAAEDRLTETFLGEARRYTSHQVAELAGVPVYRARRFWRALGFANVADDVTAFTDADVAALRTLLGLVAEGVYDEEQALLLARALGLATARLAESQVGLGAEALDPAGAAGAQAHRRPALWRGRAERVLPDLERLMTYAWRRNLAVSAGRRGDRERPTGRPAVGFADLVGFTRLSGRLTERELTQLVERFESRSADVITLCGGRVIKTLGDAVLFLTDRPRDAAEVGLRLVEEHRRARRMPELRVGLAAGPVVGRMGDVFGTTVNLASRLTALAVPGTVLADPAFAAELVGDPAFLLRPVGGLTVRGLGALVPSAVQRSRGQGRIS